MNIYQKIVEIRKSIDVFKKDTKGYGYDYVSGAQVLKKVKDKMDELGVILEPHVLNQQHETFDYTAKGEEKTDFIVWGEMEYHWVNAEKPDDRIVVKWQMFGQQNDISKAFGSGLTYSERYFLLKYFGVPTDEDDPDKRNTTGKQQRKLSQAQVNRLFAIAKSKGITAAQVKEAIMVYKKTNAEDLTKQEYDALIARMEQKGA